MKHAIKLEVKQRTPEWLEARRRLVTGTDIPAILGVSPWRSEADVAADKLGDAESADHLRMRVGSALEPFIAKEYAAQTGRRVVRADGLYQHYRLQWAGASLDYRCRSHDVIVECKWTGSRSRFADGLPQDVEAQVRWQLGVTGAAAADVAVLVAGDELVVLRVEADAAVFADMVSVAEDFRRRLAAGGPFSHETATTRGSRTPDDGTSIAADDELAATVRELLVVKRAIARLEADERAAEDAIKARMGDAAAVVGAGFRVTWKASERSTTDWAAVATSAMTSLSDDARAELVARNTKRIPLRVFRAVGEEEAI